MNQDYKIDLLGSTPIFGGMNSDQLNELVSDANFIEFDKGKTIFRQYDVADSAFVVSAGLVQLIRVARGKPVDVIDVGVGCTLGEKALLVESRRPVSAVAKNSCVVIEIKRDKFRKVLDENPELASIIRNHMVEKLFNSKMELTLNVTNFKEQFLAEKN